MAGRHAITSSGPVGAAEVIFGQRQQRLRLMPVATDAMVPTLRHGDFVMVLPIDRFAGEGLYVFDFLGEPDVYRVEMLLGADGGLRVFKDNTLCGPGSVITGERFREAVLGKVVATCGVLHRALLGL